MDCQECHQDIIGVIGQASQQDLVVRIHHVAHQDQISSERCHQGNWASFKLRSKLSIIALLDEFAKVKIETWLAEIVKLSSRMF